MSRIKYISVVEIEGHGRQIRPGKTKREGAELALPTPENDREQFERRTWERVGVFTLPEEMPKSEFKDWWNEHKDDDPQPSPIPEVLHAMKNGDAEPEEVEA